MIDMRAGLGGGTGFKVDEIPSSTFIQNVPAGLLYTLNPGVGKVARLTYLALTASSGTVANITVKFGTRTVINNKTVGAIYSSAGSLDHTIGGGTATMARYIEGLEGEVLTVSAGTAVGNDGIRILGVVGSYK